MSFDFMVSDKEYFDYDLIEISAWLFTNLTQEIDERQFHHISQS